MSNLIPIIQAEKINKSFKTFQLKNINLKIYQNDIMGVIGENGAGKTTLLKIISGLSAQTSGNITTNNPRIYFGFDSIPYPKKLTILELAKVLDKLQWNWNNEKFNKYINDFDLPKKVIIKNFSKGMKMELNVAVGLSSVSDILIFDEVTSGLDPIMRKNVLAKIKHYALEQNVPLIISTHNLNDISDICNRFIILKNGEKILDKNTNDIDMNNLQKIFEDNVNQINRGARNERTYFKG
ncbi:ATP-binding cassette domain-containing protein [Companilactobacillus nodensis]|uniref:ABC superfamily ATP binding cassette transporter, ABC protein n=1 Tax=Companilactobacillus nodensis DSM 19682 = JCM 14932 = NBRC 107160 TaxID=1423775 RepID=A0A0R1K9N4_9LACO|nr:ABC transporter ATP-binding protein [Companilactobacillus nodensis]KRK80406.1 ABC superfamily ATP binding cassette transporter, ABC protein [Companilactobacillus nodensis DSM 19682 = JCM 14932 = NBRC 107160]